MSLEFRNFFFLISISNWLITSSIIKKLNKFHFFKVLDQIAAQLGRTKGGPYSTF